MSIHDSSEGGGGTSSSHTFTGRVVDVSGIKASVNDASVAINEVCNEMRITPGTSFTVGPDGVSQPVAEIKLLGSSQVFETGHADMTPSKAHIKLCQADTAGHRFLDMYGEELQIATGSQMLVAGDGIDDTSLNGFISYNADWYITDSAITSALDDDDDFKIKLGKDGQIHAKGALDVDAAADISGVLSVGASDVDMAVRGGATFAEDVTMSDTLGVASLASFTKAQGTGLAVTADATIGGGLDVTGTLDAGDTDIDGSLDVSGAVGLAATDVATTVRGSISVAQNADLNGQLDVAGATSLAATDVATAVRGSISVAQDADLNGALDVAGAVDLAATDVATAVRGSFSVAQDADLNGALDVAGAASLAAQNVATTVRGSISVAQNADLNGELDVAGATSLAASGTATAVRGDLTVAEGIDVEGDSDISGQLTLSKNEGNGLVVDSDALISGNLTMGGYIAGPQSMTIDPATVGDATGTLIVQGNLDVKGTTTYIDSTTVSIQDLNMQLGDNATSQAALDGAGIQTGGTMSEGQVAPSFVYVASDDAWEANKKLRSQKGLAFGGASYDKFTVSPAGVVAIGSTLDVTGNVTLSAALDVTLDATLSSELIMSASNNIYLNGSAGSAKILSDANNGVSILGASITMDGSSIHPSTSGDSDLGTSQLKFGNLHLSTNANIGGDADIDGGLDAAGVVSLGATSAATNIRGAANVTGAATLSDSLSVAETTVLAKSVTIGNATAASSVQKVAGAAAVDFGASENRFNDFFFINGDISTDLDVGVNLSVGADISVTANATFSGDNQTWNPESTQAYDFTVAGLAQFSKQASFEEDIYGLNQAWQLTTLGKFAGKHAAFSLASDSSVDFKHDSDANTMAHRFSGSELAIGLTSLDSEEAKKFSVAVATGNIASEGTLTVAGATDLNGSLDVASRCLLAASGVATQVRGLFTADEAATFDGTVALNDDVTLATTKSFILDNYDADGQRSIKRVAISSDYSDPDNDAQPTSGADDILITEGYLFEALIGNDTLVQLSDFTDTNKAASRALRINADDDGFDVSPAVELPDSGARLLEGKLLSAMHPIAAGEAMSQYQLAYVDMDGTSGSISTKKAYGKDISGSFSSSDLMYLNGAMLLAADVANGAKPEMVMVGQVIKDQPASGFVGSSVGSPMSAQDEASAKASAASTLIGAQIIAPASADAGKLNVGSRYGDYVHMMLGMILDFTVVEDSNNPGMFLINTITWVYTPQQPELKFQ